MKLLADTHIFLWAVGDPGRLPAPARQGLEQPGAEIWLSAVSVWEARLKIDKGKLEIGEPLEALVEDFLAGGAQILPLGLAHAALRLPDPPETADPFDRMLLAQCEAEGMRLLTVDDTLAAHRLAWRP